MESESKWPVGLRKKLLFGLAVLFAVLGACLLVLSLVELYSHEDTALAQRLHLDLDDACSVNLTLRDFRPIAFSLSGEPERYLVCGWTPGPTGLRVVAVVAALAAAALALLALTKFKLPTLQYAASGVAAFCGLLFFIAVVVDGNAVSRAANVDVCYFGYFSSDPSVKYECHPGKYIAVVVLDMLLAILLIGYAVVAFFFVKSGRYAVEVAENSSVDYFGEAERYFPSGGSEENEGLAK